MIPNDPITWMFVFGRVSALLVVLPIFSATNVPVRLRVALGALVACLVSAILPPTPVSHLSFGAVVSMMGVEVGIGLVLGFVCRILFYAVELAGTVITTEMGLMMTADFNPFLGTQSQAPGTALYFLAITLFLSFDLHHWLLAGLQRSYRLLPIGGAHLSAPLLIDVVARTSSIFVIAVQIAAPLIAVSLVITLVFSVLSRAVPQMNVFSESFAFRILAGLAVFGLTLNLMAEHILNYLHRLPEDLLRVAQILGAR